MGLAIAAAAARATWLGLATVLSLALLGTQPAAAAAQTQSERPLVAYEAEVTKLAQELVASRQMIALLMRMIGEQEALLRSARAADSAGRRLMAQAQLLRVQLEATAARRDSLQRQLGAVCGEKRQGWIGLTLRSIATVRLPRPGERAVEMRFDRHPVVESVDPGSPADKAGIRRGDTVLAIGGVDVGSHPVLPAHVLRPGATASVQIRRNGRSWTLPVTVAPRPDFPSPAGWVCPWLDATLAAAVAPEVSPSVNSRALGTWVAPQPALPQPGALPIAQPGALPKGQSLTVAHSMDSVQARVRLLGFAAGPLTSVSSSVAGFELVPMNADLAEFFGSSEGLLVIRVLPGTPAHESGFRAGDVLLEASGVRLATSGQLANLLARSSGRQLELILLRKRERQTLALRW
jgi:S1-C subfamily serine protease